MTGPVEPGGTHREELSSPARLRAVLRKERDAPRVAFEVDAGGAVAVGATLAGLTLCFEPGAVYHVPLDREKADVGALLGALRPLLEGADPQKVAHDAKFGVMVLRQHGVELGVPGFDTLLAGSLLDGRPAKLEKLAVDRLGAAPEAARVSSALRLCEVLEAELEERGQLEYLREFELPLVPVLAGMELAGVAVDVGALEALSHRLEGRLRELDAEMSEMAGYGINARSPRQLGKLLYEDLGLKGSRKTRSGLYSTDALALEMLAGQHPVVEKIVEHRHLSRLKDAYADALPKLVNPGTGRLHTNFSQVAASSGRLSSVEPNLQNLPVRTELGREIRKAFVADGSGMGGSTVLLSADYSQIELRVLAHLTGEAALVEAFANHQDVHALTAARLYGVPPEAVDARMRRVGKTLNYGVIYGMSGYRLALEASIDRKEAVAFVRHHREQYPAVRAYFENTLREAENRGYVETPFGRRRYLPELHSKNRQRREAARRAAENMPNQGMVAEIIKRAMIGVHARLRERGMSSRMLLQVHDELLLEVPAAEMGEAAGLVAREMEGAAQLSVPLEVETRYGPSWGEMEPLGV